MGKAELQVQLNELSSKFTTVTANISELESVKSSLSGVSTEITYDLTDYDTIKTMYYRGNPMSRRQQMRKNC